MPLSLWPPEYRAQKQNCCFAVTRALCTAAWEFCRGLCYLLESSSAKQRILHLFLQREILGLGAGGERRPGLAELGASSDVSLTFIPVCVASRAVTARSKKICCFLPDHFCAVTDHANSLVGITESHDHLRDMLQEMRLELSHSLTLRCRSSFFTAQDAPPTHAAPASTRWSCPGSQD